MGKREQKDQMSTPATGGISLLTVFAVLALTVFALLSLSTVRADERLSKASAQAVQDYYVADGAAQEILAQLRHGDAPPNVTVDNNTYTYTVPISDRQELQVEVQIGEGEYTVLKWQAVATGHIEEADRRLDLWDGQSF